MCYIILYTTQPYAYNNAVRHTFMGTHTFTHAHTQVNEVFRSQFETWMGDHPQVQLVSDGSHSNEERLGAVGCVDLAVRHFQIKDDLIVIGG